MRLFPEAALYSSTASVKTRVPEHLQIVHLLTSPYIDIWPCKVLLMFIYISKVANSCMPILYKDNALKTFDASKNAQNSRRQRAYRSLTAKDIVAL